ncbi:MAG: hypothetical protein H7Y59_13460 [Anaerolineales bacterium]|nr:hypothetical protein [Anaerolineales bacterium]
MKRRKQNSKNPLLFIVGSGLLLIVIGLMLASQNTSTAPTTAALSEEEADALVPRVSLVDSKAALDSGSAIFLDVRTAEAFQSERITGSINIPLAELESRMTELDPEQWIITYCT